MSPIWIETSTCPVPHCFTIPRQFCVLTNFVSMVIQTFLRIILLDFLGGYRSDGQETIYISLLTDCDDGMKTKLLAGTCLASVHCNFPEFWGRIYFYNERSGRARPGYEVSAESQVHRTLMFIVVYHDEGNWSGWSSMVSGCESSCPCSL